MKKSAQVTEPDTTERPSEIHGLREALEAERRAEQALSDIRTRHEAAWYTHGTARAYLHLLEDRAGTGEAIEPAEIVAAKLAINEAADAVNTFPPVVSRAEGRLEDAKNGVVGVLRDELRNRRDAAQQALLMAEAALVAAARDRAAKADALAAARGIIEHASQETVRAMFAADIEAASCP